MEALDLPDDMWRVIGDDHLDPVDLIPLRLAHRHFRTLFKRPTFHWLHGPTGAALDSGRLDAAFVLWQLGWERADAYARYAVWPMKASRMLKQVLTSATSTPTEDAVLSFYLKLVAYEHVKSALHRDLCIGALRHRFLKLFEQLAPCWEAKTTRLHRAILRRLASQGRTADLLYVLHASRLRPEDIPPAEAADLIMPLVLLAAEAGHLEVLVALGHFYPAAFASRSGRRRFKMECNFAGFNVRDDLMKWLATVYPSTRSSWRRWTKRTRQLAFELK